MKPWTRTTLLALTVCLAAPALAEDSSDGVALTDEHLRYGYWAPQMPGVLKAVPFRLPQRVEAIDGPTGPAVPAGYELVWHDEFDADGLDTDRWNHRTAESVPHAIRGPEAVWVESEGWPSSPVSGSAASSGSPSLSASGRT